MKVFVPICIAAFWFLGCAKPESPRLSRDAVKALICGAYVGNYFEGTESFEIKPDGSFSQKFVKNGVPLYEQKGTWNFEPKEEGYAIRFEPFMDLHEAIIAEWQKSPPPGKGPERFSAGTAAFYEDEPRIYFDRDMNYFITKRPIKGEKKKSKTLDTKHPDLVKLKFSPKPAYD